MTREDAGHERIRRISRSLEQSGLDCLLCCLPSDVLLLSGYWPVVGTSIAIAISDGRVLVLVPEDEEELARAGWAEVRTYKPGSLESNALPSETVETPLGILMAEFGLVGSTVGMEERAIYEVSSYSATYRMQSVISDIVWRAAPNVQCADADDVIASLRACLTSFEVDEVRLACRVAAEGFEEGLNSVVAGVREPEVAAAFANPIQAKGLASPRVERAGAFTWCMSGENSALAGGAYARTRDRELRDGDLVLVHCNSYIDGYFTDITRTYVIGPPDERQQSIYAAIFEARSAALEAIRPGVRAAAVDAAARDVLRDAGFGKYFTHGLGHSLGFTAISPDFPPRLHPASDDVLEAGSTFNIEPSVYIQGYGGIRHCDVVTVTDSGPDVLTPFQDDIEALTVS